MEVREVLELLCGVCLVSPYDANFVDVGVTAMRGEDLHSSVHFVKSWLREHFCGHTRQSLRGLLRMCEGTDMQLSRLTDNVRSNSWDQLLKYGLSETLARCIVILADDVVEPTTRIIDEYRSDVLAQLEMLEAVATSPVRAGSRTLISPKTSQAGKKKTSEGPSVQSEVDVSLSQSKLAAGTSTTVSERAQGVQITKGGAGLNRRSKSTEGRPSRPRVYVSLM